MVGQAGAGMKIPSIPKSEFVGTIASFNPYLNSEETSIVVALTDNVAPKVFIEFGCNYGRTAKTLLHHVLSLEKYIGIDVPSEHEPLLACQRSEIPYNAGGFAATDPRFFLLLRNSLELEARDLEPCDAVFIDGDHSERAVLHDSNLACALLRPGGIIIWHDYGNNAVEVTQALHYLHQQCGWRITPVRDTWLAYAKF